MLPDRGLGSLAPLPEAGDVRGLRRGNVVAPDGVYYSWRGPAAVAAAAGGATVPAAVSARHDAGERRGEEQRFVEKAAEVGAGLGSSILLLLVCLLVCLGRLMAEKERKYAGMMKLRTEGGGVAEMTSPEAAALPAGALA